MNTSDLTVLAGLIGVTAVVLAVIAVRHPTARRLALRSFGRRPGETILVIIGSLLGTAIITGSLIVGDTLNHSIRVGAFTQLGPIDQTVTAPGPESLPRLRENLAGLEESPEVDGTLFGLRAPGTAAARLDSDTAAVHPDALLLEVDLGEAQSLGGDPEATGLHDVATPQAGQAALSSDLADELGVAVGEQIAVDAYGDRHSLEVSEVLPRRGVAGYATGLDPRSFNVFVTPGTLSEWAAAAPEGYRVPPPVALGFVSNRGGVLDGAERSDQVTELIRQRIAGMPMAEVTQSKQQVLDAAEGVGSRLSEIFLGIGSFSVLAGLLLLVNVFVMLAQERRRELGILRAVGTQRGSLVRAFFLEGSLYAVAASLLGVVAGIGVGAGIVRLARGISGGPAGFTLDIRFAAEPASLLGGALLGLVISLATILVTSLRISRLNIIRAIRELPEPPHPTRLAVRMAVGAAATGTGLAVTVAAVSTEAGALLFLGPAILAVGLVQLLGRLLGHRRTVTIIGLGLLAWGVAAPTLLSGVFRQAEVLVFVVQGLVITGAAVVVLAYNQPAVGKLARRAAGGVRSLAARLGLAYPLARPFRTTMTLTMYALVVFMVMLVSLFSQVFASQVDAFSRAESGGYHLLVDSAASDPLPAEAAVDVERVEAVAPIRYAAYTVEFRAPGQSEFRRWFASGFDQRFLENGPLTLARWLPEFPDEESVWRHVLENPSAMIVDAQFLQEGGDPQQVEPGDEVEIRNPMTGETEERTVVATTEGGLAFSGAFLSDESLASVTGPMAPANRLYVALGDEANPTEVAAALEERHLSRGVEARSFDAVVAERQQQNLQFLGILQGFLMLGLLVGIAGLAVIMVRAVRERRRQVGTLRSLGLQIRTVAGTFMLEAGFVAFQGIAVGALLGTATAYQLIENAAVFGGIDVAFTIPWSEVLLLLGITLAASITAAGWPARQASRIRPAVALRTVE